MVLGGGNLPDVNLYFWAFVNNSTKRPAELPNEIQQTEFNVHDFILQPNKTVTSHFMIDT